MLTLIALGGHVAEARRRLDLSQKELARKAGISRATLEALENGRSGEIGFSRLSRLLSALGLELKLQDTPSQRPTLEQLLEEQDDEY